MNRRDFFSAAAASLVAPAIRLQRPAQRARTRLILLGTGGGPTPKKSVSASAQVIVVNDTAYVVDCGDGVARQLVSADVPLRNLRHIFITHHHSDHNADYGNLLLLSWASGLISNVDTWGPPPLAKMTELFLALNAYDIDIRIRDEGRVPLAPLIHSHELMQGRVVMQDENVRVTSTLVDHPLVTPAFAYRFDGPDRSIVISGDTARSDNLVKLARGADVLVHEACGCRQSIGSSRATSRRRRSKSTCSRATRRWRIADASHRPLVSRRSSSLILSLVAMRRSPTRCG